MAVHATLLLRRPAPDAPPAIRSLADLLGQSELTYGALAGGMVQRTLRTANVTSLRTLWHRMSRFRPSAFARTNREGIARVRREKYAYVLPDTVAERVAGRPPCDLLTVGRLLPAPGHSLAVQKGSALRRRLDAALGRLRAAGVLDALRHKWWARDDACRTAARVAPSSGWVASDGARLAEIARTSLPLAAIAARYAVSSDV